MNLLRRFEVWLLLILAAGVSVFVLLQSRTSEQDRPTITDTAPARTKQEPEVLAIAIERDHGNARLDVEVRLTNHRDSSLLLVKPAVQLLNAAQKEVPAFILPVEPPPEVPARTQASAKLRFWLEKEDLAGKLTLVLDGTSFEVKDDRPFALDALKNGELKKSPW